MIEHLIFAREHLIINEAHIVSAEFIPDGVNPKQQPALLISLTDQSRAGAGDHRIILVGSDAERVWDYLKGQAKQVRS